MPRFRKLPVEIEAVRIPRSALHWSAPPPWLQAAEDSGVIVVGDHGVTIETREGAMLGGPGDWIIRGVAGELYPCKDEIFRLTYEPAEPDPRPTLRRSYTVPPMQTQPGAVLCTCGRLIQRLDVSGNVQRETELAHPACGKDGPLTVAERTEAITARAAAR